MIPVTDLRKGVTFEVDGQPYKVLEYSHIKMGRGGATIRVSLRNLLTGSVEVKTFNSGATVLPITTVKRRLQYLYQDGDNVVFMDPNSFEQIEIERDTVSGKLKFLKEGQEVDIVFWSLNGARDHERPLEIDLPSNIVLTVTEADPGVKGNSAANFYKQIKLENGLTIKAPLFIKAGDKIRVDTRTGEYIERAT